MQISTIGLDLAKNVFQVHGIDASEKVIVRKQLRRSQVIAFFKALPPCLLGMEACATAPIRKPSDRDATLQHGSDWCHARIQLEASRGLAASQSRGIATCGASWLWVRTPSCGARDST